MSVQTASHRGRGIRNVTMVIQRLRPLFSGQGVQVEMLAGELARREIDTTIVTAGQGPRGRRESVGGYRVHRLRADTPRLSKLFGGRSFRSPVFGVRMLLWLLIHGWRIQLIHFHAASDALYTSWLFARIRRIPLIFEMTLLGADDAETFASDRRRFSGLRNAVFRRCDGYVAISPALARAFEAEGLDAGRLRVIPQGVDTDEFRPTTDPAAIRRRLDLPADGPILVFVGSLIERKGIDILLDAWSLIHAAAPETRLLLVGPDTFDHDPSAEAFLLTRLDSLDSGAREAVIRVGARDDVAEYLRASDLFLFPSRREGFGTVMIEAMACGLPCVVAELTDITDFIFDSDEPSGVVVPQEDPQRLADAALELLRSPESARSIGAAARRRVEARFSARRIGDEYVTFYRELCGIDGGS